MKSNFDTDTANSNISLSANCKARELVCYCAYLFVCVKICSQVDFGIVTATEFAVNLVIFHSSCDLPMLCNELIASLISSKLQKKESFAAAYQA